jgi:hypothetical protein
MGLIKYSLKVLIMFRLNRGFKEVLNVVLSFEGNFKLNIYSNELHIRGVASDNILTMDFNPLIICRI